MDVVLQRLFQHEGEVARFGAVAIVIGSFVIDLCHCHVEHSFGPVDLRRDLREVGDLERCPVLLDQLHERNIVEIQLIVLDGEFVLGKVERLFDQIDVLVFHGLLGVVLPIRSSYIGNF